MDICLKSKRPLSGVESVEEEDEVCLCNTRALGGDVSLLDRLRMSFECTGGFPQLAASLPLGEWDSGTASNARLWDVDIDTDIVGGTVSSIREWIRTLYATGRRCDGCR